MTILRLYELDPNADQAPALEAAVRRLAVQISALPGCASVRLMRDREVGTILFLEQWDNETAYAESSKLLDRAAFAPVMAAVQSAPRMRELDLY